MEVIRASHAPVTLYTEEYGQPSEVWIHRQVTGLPDWIGAVAAKDFVNRETFSVPEEINLGWGTDLQHRLAHLRWGLRKLRWIPDDELEVLEDAARLRTGDPKLLHCHFLWNAEFALAISHELGIPLIVTAHGSDVNRARIDMAYRARLEIVFLNCSCMIAVSKFIERVLLEIGCPKEKIRVLPLGAPIPSQPAPRTGEIFAWICIGSLLPVKGHEFLIRAFAKAHKQNGKMELLLVGDGEGRVALEHLAKELGVSDTIQFKGIQSPEQVEKLLQQAHGCVLASIVEQGSKGLKEEGLPISLVEAAAHGLPLVATDCGGIPEICLDGENGLLVPCEDAQALSDALLKVTMDNSLAVSMGHKSLEYVQANYALDDCTQRLAELYASILGDRGEPA
ncbi:hypothetical protein BVY04_01285 [bacterium M21]|nr:hypothetical protein BVY04_01285 [bacterium M21]